MRTQNRIYGMIICLIMLVFTLVLMVIQEQDFAAMLLMFVAGYGLRETLQRDDENATVKK